MPTVRPELRLTPDEQSAVDGPDEQSAVDGPDATLMSRGTLFDLAYMSETALRLACLLLSWTNPDTDGGIDLGGLPELAQILSVTRRTLREAVQELESKKCLVVHRTNGVTSRYDVSPMRPVRGARLTEIAA